MRSVKRERGVLKLVHPGRYIEVHREPITAAEVMRRNPRHCITRPDVFKFPWIVVKPESLLLPGSVFLIVPNHTIYYLLKAKGQSSNSHLPFSQQNQSHPFNNHVHQYQLKQDSPVTISSYSDEMSSSRVQSHKQHIKGQYVRLEKEGEERELLVKGKLHIFNKMFPPLSFLFPFSQRSPNCPGDKTVLSPDWEETVELLPKVINYEDTDHKTMEQESLDESNFEFTPYQAVQYYQNYSRDVNMGLEISKKDVSLEFVPNEQVNNNMLKSCLRRPNSIRKSLNLKVSFNISIEKEE